MPTVCLCLELARDWLGRMGFLGLAMWGLGRGGGPACWAVGEPPLSARVVAGSGGWRAGAGLALTVAEVGVYEVSSAEIADGLGLAVEEVGRRLLAGELSLSTRGRAVAYIPVAKGVGLRFFGFPSKTAYSDSGMYVLREGAGLLAPVKRLAAPVEPGNPVVFCQRVYEEDRLATLDLRTAGDQDVWSWAKLSSGDAILGQIEVPVQVVGRRAGPATLTVCLRGGCAVVGVAAEHHVELSINGRPIGEVRWGGLTEMRQALSFSSMLLRDGENRVGFRALAVDGVVAGVCLLESFELGYSRQATVVDGWLEAYLPGAATYAFSGFSEPEVELLEVTDPSRPTVLAGGVVKACDGGYELSFQTGERGRRVVAYVPAALKLPNLRRVAVDTLKDRANAADYLVVCPASLLAAGERLAEYRRQANGMLTRVVTFEQVIDAFADSANEPLAIRELLVYAREHWAQAPQYVALVGAGNYAYYGPAADNPLPPPLIANRFGVHCNDAPLADLDGDGFPEVAVGRIPVRDDRQMVDYLDKLWRYEKGDLRQWAQSALLVADASDGAGERFAADVAELAGLLPSTVSRQLLAVDSTAVAAARGQLLSALAAGVRLFCYVGHGSLTQLSRHGLLTAADCLQLVDNELPTLLLAASCLVGNFAVPGRASLGEQMLLLPNGGAVGVVAAVSMLNNSANLHFNRALLRAMLASEGGTLGEALLAMPRGPGVDSGRARSGESFAVLGCPALRLRLQGRGEPAPVWEAQFGLKGESGERP